MTLRAIVWMFCVACAATAAAGEDTLFEKSVAPLLQERCLSCHNPQRAEGEYDMSTREHLIQGGEEGFAIDLEHPLKSRLLKLVDGLNPKMPKEGKPLSAESVADLKKWIESGASWPAGRTLKVPPRTNRSGLDFWSYQPLKRPPVPVFHAASNDTRADISKWIRNSIDAFVLAKMREKGLSPAPEASRQTLIRRLSFDLLGLPPTPEETAAFVADSSENAYEKLVERLLASPHYGERWGRHWLDVVHYGDTHGYDKDKPRPNAWLYRDYVIRSFNADKPYARFIKEQLAGDVLFPRDPDGIVATGFIAAGPWDLVGQTELKEGSTDKEITRVLDRDDMVSSTAATFLSMTVQCARCHDHKFDPIPQKDYYGLQAVFAGVERGDRPYGESVEQAKLRDRLEREKAELKKQRESIAASIKAKTTPELSEMESTSQTLHKELSAMSLPADSIRSPTNGYHSQFAPSADTLKWVQVDFGRSVALDEIRLVPARPTDFRDTPGFGFPIRFKVELSDDVDFVLSENIAAHTTEDVSNPGANTFIIRRPDSKKWSARFVRVTATLLAKSNGWMFALAELQAYSKEGNVALNAKVTALDSIEAGRWSTRNLVDGFDSRVKLLNDHSSSNVATAETKDANLRAKLVGEIEELEKKRTALSDAITGPELKAALTKTDVNLASVESKIKSVPAQNMVYAAISRQPRNIRILNRGNVTEPGAQASPSGLSVLEPLGLSCTFKFEDAANEGARRAALAEWIADPKNVLARRSIVNRVWHYHFGKGIVDSPNDFGYNGSRPAHPELLDWLALEFLDSGESFKKLHTLIVTSSTYRQACVSNPTFEKIDADNRLLWRANRRRLDAESLRDAVLSISGKLDATVCGAPFKPFKFKDDHSPVYDYTTFSKTESPETFRRTIYRFTVRSVPDPFLDCLDCADSNLNTHVRNTTNTALQALTMLNDPFLIRQSTYLSERLKSKFTRADEQIEAAFKQVLGRAPTDLESKALLNYSEKHGLPNACRMLLNSNEFMFID